MADDKVRKEDMEESGAGAPERDKLDELLADVPEWLRGPLKENYKQILASIAIVILVVSLWSGYSFYTNRQEESASYHLGLAMSNLDLDGRLKELDDLVRRFPHTDAGHLANLLIARAYFEKGNWEKAGKVFASCESSFEGALATTATMGNGYASEQVKRLDQALADYEKAGNAGNGFEAVALIDKARVLATEGKKKEALDAYDKYLDLKPKSHLLDFIRYQILKLS